MSKVRAVALSSSFPPLTVLERNKILSFGSTPDQAVARAPVNVLSDRGCNKFGITDYCLLFKDFM